MKYMGSKNRIAKYLIPIMLDDAKKNNICTFVDVFVGGGNLIDKIPNTYKRIGIDNNPHTIQALIAIRDMVDVLPDKLSEDEYKILKNQEPSPISSWLRFVSSFGGKFDGGYAREQGSDEYTFVGYGKRNAQKQSPLLCNVDLRVASYDTYNFEGCLIYCDPPYKDTTSYKTDKFDHEKFFDWCRKMSKNNIVYLSEYNAPQDFECIYQCEVKTNFASQRDKGFKSIEKLFKV